MPNKEKKRMLAPPAETILLPPLHVGGHVLNLFYDRKPGAIPAELGALVMTWVSFLKNPVLQLDSEDEAYALAQKEYDALIETARFHPQAMLMLLRAAASDAAQYLGMRELVVILESASSGDQ
ncbi:hypothetical protein LC612_30475 [Nostoc sp. CHAB 5834]|nr:hypothetical protein [Nostoc sp. CHAB 5834]